MIDILQDINVDGKDLRIIRNMYWEQTATIKINNVLGEYHPIKRGVRQGCVMSPELFSLYTEQIMRHIENMPGTQVNGHIINNLRYADDTALIANTEKDLQALLDIVVNESEKMGLSLNPNKTETMVISRSANVPTCRIKIKHQEIKQVHAFKYLSSLITPDGKCEKEIKCRIAQAKTAFQKMKSMFTSNIPRIET